MLLWPPWPNHRPSYLGKRVSCFNVRPISWKHWSDEGTTALTGAVLYMVAHRPPMNRGKASFFTLSMRDLINPTSLSILLSTFVAACFMINRYYCQSTTGGRPLSLNVADKNPATENVWTASWPNDWSFGAHEEYQTWCLRNIKLWCLWIVSLNGDHGRQSFHLHDGMRDTRREASAPM